MKKNKYLLLIIILISSVVLLKAQTFYPDGDSFSSTEIISFDWYLDSDTVTNNFYVYNDDTIRVYQVYGNPSGQNHNEGQVFEAGNYSYYAKGYNAETGIVYIMDTYYFTVIQDTEECQIDAVISNVLCDDNGTGEDPTDDTFTFEVNVTGSNTGTGWTANDALNTADTFVNNTTSFGPYLVSGGNLSFTISDNDDTECSTSINVDAPATCSDDVSENTRLEQYGITWFIQGKPEYGQYANGEYWVVGPITLQKISPQSFQYNMQSLSDGSPLPAEAEVHDIDRIINGSMINPSIGYNHGFDDELSIWKVSNGSYPKRISNYDMNKNFYKEDLNIARIDIGGGIYEPISTANPRTILPNSSIVSSISTAIPDRPCLEVTAILTVVAESNKPIEGDFRPPYCGNDKKSKFNILDLDYSSLKSLKKTATMPSLAEVESFFERNWIDFLSEWVGEFTHAKQNMRDSYGAGLAAMISMGGLALNTDYGNGSTDKETLLKRMVQLGIDLYGTVTQPGGDVVFRNNGGLLVGRKFPILLAGKVLNNTDMLNIKTLKPEIHFHEDDQAFYVDQSDIDITNGSSWDPDDRDIEHIPYSEEDLGLPEFGIRHSNKPYISNKYWETVYRRCCNHSSVQGAILAAHAMGIKEEWAHDAIFDYMDRYLSIEKQIYFGVEPQEFSINKSALYGRVPVSNFSNYYGMFDMWDMHRKSFGDVWTRCDTTYVYSNACKPDATSDLSIGSIFELKNFPDPFVKVTTISFELPQSGMVILEIFNTMGEHVRTLVNEPMNQGQHDTNFNASTLPKGAYICRLQFGTMVQSEGMLIIN